MLYDKSLLKVSVIITILCMMNFTYALAQDNSKFLIEPRITMTTGDGEPAHDIPRVGLLGRYHLFNGWHIALALDYAEYDFERPYKVLGINSVDETDAIVSGIVLGAGVEREFSLNPHFKPYVGGGLGVGFFDADDITSQVEGGGIYNISTDPGTELIPYLNGGVRWMFWRNFSLGIGAKLEYHLADWDVKDRVSGRTASIDNYIQYGGYFGLGIHF